MPIIKWFERTKDFRIETKQKWEDFVYSILFLLLFIEIIYFIFN